MKKRRIVYGLILCAGLVLVVMGGCKPIPYYLQMVNKVHGTVTDAHSGYPIESVEVSILTYQYSDLTNGLGDYELEMADGSWEIEFVRGGYVGQVHEVVFEDGVDRVELNVALIPEDPGPGEGSIVFGTVYLAEGFEGEVSPTSPLTINMLSDGGVTSDIHTYPLDDGTYDFPFDYGVIVDGETTYDMIMTLLDKNGDSVLNTGDYFGWRYEPVVPDSGDVYGVDLVLDTEVNDGYLTVTLTDAAAAAGQIFYFAAVEFGVGDPNNPDDWLAAGMSEIRPDGIANDPVREIIDPYTFELGDPALLPGGVYGVFFFVDLVGNGPPPETGDLGGDTPVILAGDTETSWSYDWLNPF